MVEDDMSESLVAVVIAFAPFVATSFFRLLDQQMQPVSSVQ
jgi:hypothetical protein